MAADLIPLALALSPSGEMHLDFIGTYPKPVMIAQGSFVAFSNRFFVVVGKRAVGAVIDDLPIAGAESQGAMAAGNHLVHVAQHPIHAGSTTDSELPAIERTRFGCDSRRAAQDGQGQLHRVSLQPDTWKPGGDSSGCNGRKS